jgi:predicted nucleic acid-binding protein
MMLPDGNLLIAFKHAGHTDHAKSVTFFTANQQVATCPITELNLVRVLMQLNYTGQQADTLLQDFISKHRARLIAADLSATVIQGLCKGHRGTTDAYLAQLAKTNGLTLATLDEQLATRFPQVAQLVT